MADQINTMAQAKNSENKNTQSALILEQNPAPAPLRSTTKLFDTVELRKVIDRMSQDKADCDYISKIQARTTKVVVKALFEKSFKSG